MSQSEDEMSKHLQSAIFGTPVLHPDEQHRNLGTFHERIDLGITFTQALLRDYSAELETEISAHPNYQLLLHGLLDQDILDRYIKLANQANLKFAIRNDLLYLHEPDSLAIALAAPCAIQPATINIDDRFPQPASATTSTIPKQLLLERIYQHLERNRRNYHQRHQTK
ncbi:YueI family protein [Lactiplantibacillus sp. WILCCON 0030]|uniref:YueI family protein n=1 Tax=Lactiplantibacillus brownii TaxID=3069269 RepID=A0ABU1AB34_9LACO|nr:YueI family protein [Lactiplantibacillus brownii]MDQ7938125.1 YueI family protein [Lactiplantibacillus brownii]